MAIKIAVVDDDEVFRNEVTAALEEESWKQKFPMDIEQFLDGRRLTGMLDDKQNFDIYFLDVQMEYMTGLELARCIRRIDPEATIVFLTSYEKYAIEGYQYEAFDYILKSEWKKRLPDVIKRAKKKAERRNASLYRIKTEIRYEVVYFQDVLFIEKQKKNVIFHCLENKTYYERKTLEKVYEQFPQDEFVHVNRGQIVNLKYVIYMDRDIVRLVDNTVLDISRYALSDIRQRMLRYGRDLA